MRGEAPHFWPTHNLKLWVFYKIPFFSWFPWLVVLKVKKSQEIMKSIILKIYQISVRNKYQLPLSRGWNVKSADERCKFEGFLDRGGYLNICEIRVTKKFPQEISNLTMCLQCAFWCRENELFRRSKRRWKIQNLYFLGR